MDTNGYPEEGDLEAVKTLDFKKFSDGAQTLLDLFESTGIGSGKLEDDEEEGYLRLTLHTGGWSGCEEIIGELERADPVESLWWMMYWHSSTRGGHYVFKGRK